MPILWINMGAPHGMTNGHAMPIFPRANNKIETRRASG